MFQSENLTVWSFHSVCCSYLSFHYFTWLLITLGKPHLVQSLLFQPKLHCNWSSKWIIAGLFLQTTHLIWWLTNTVHNRSCPSISLDFFFNRSILDELLLYFPNILLCHGTLYVFLLYIPFCVGNFKSFWLNLYAFSSIIAFQFHMVNVESYVGKEERTLKVF